MFLAAKHSIEVLLRSLEVTEMKLYLGKAKQSLVVLWVVFKTFLIVLESFIEVSCYMTHLSLEEEKVTF